DLAENNNMISIQNQVVSLTKKGLEFTEKALDYIITNKDEKIEDMKNDFFLFRG
ncbi:MAG: manganese/zinc/iron transport system permease protein, partial [Nonlabens sp.]